MSSTCSRPSGSCRSDVAAPSAVEALQGGAGVAAVNRGAGLAELAVGTVGQDWGGTVSLSTRSGHTRARIARLRSGDGRGTCGAAAAGADRGARARGRAAALDARGGACAADRGGGLGRFGAGWSRARRVGSRALPGRACRVGGGAVGSDGAGMMRRVLCSLGLGAALSRRRPRRDRGRGDGLVLRCLLRARRASGGDGRARAARHSRRPRSPARRSSHSRSILGAGGGAAAAIVAAVLLNTRYAPISISVAPLFRGPRLRRLVESQLIVDESWALASRGGGRFDRRLLLGAGLLLYVAWVSGTAVGRARGRCARQPEGPRARRCLPGALPGAARAAAPGAARCPSRARRRSDRAGPDPVHARRERRSWPRALACLLGLRRSDS